MSLSQALNQFAQNLGRYRYDEPCAVFANQRVQSKDDSAETDIQTSQFTSHMTDSPESDTQNTFFGTQTSDSAESDTCAQVE